MDLDNTGVRARLRPVAVVVALGLAACVATAPDAARSGSRRAVLLSFDGLGGERLAGLSREGRLGAGGFSAFFQRGLVAGRAVTVTPSQTSVAHASAITGAPPSATGIVANVFHRAGDPFGSTIGGFDAEIGVETLWEAALRQGKRVGVLTYPGADGTTARRRASFGLLYPQQPLAPSRFVALGPESWVRERGARVARIPLGEGSVRGEIVLRARDGGEGALELVVSGEAPLPLRAGGWFPARTGEARPADRAAAWCRLIRADPGREQTVVYVGQLFGISGYPEEFRERVAAALGAWPGQADGRLLSGDPAAGAPPDPDAFDEQSERLSRFLTNAVLWSLRHESWDLLIGYQPGVDEVEHAFEPADPRDPERAEPSDPGARHVLRSVRNADAELARVVAAMPARDTLFVFSDHGIEHVTRAFDLGRFLSRAGWAVVGAATSAAPGAPRVQVCTGSGLAHLYVDSALPAAERERQVASLVRALRALAAEEPGLVEQMGRREEMSSVGLDHPNSGDVVVLLVPGTIFQNQVSAAGDAFDAPRSAGAHGYRATHSRLDATFLALGPGIAPSRPATVALKDVAGTVARSLGIEPPRGAGRR